MSEHHRGPWGAREDAVWWPGTLAADQQSLQHHQHLLHQQQLAAQQQVAQQQQQHDARSTAPPTTHQQLFTYKMASSFQNPATTHSISNVSSTSPVGAAGVRGYDYRLGGGMTGGNPNMTGPAAAAQWWYPSAMDNSIQNSMQQQQQQQQQQSQNNMQNMPSVHTPPPVSQAQQIVQQQQAEAQARQHQQEAQRQHQEAQRHQEVQRQQQEAHRQHQEAQRQQAEAEAQARHHHQAVVEAQVRHHQAQQQLHQQHQQPPTQQLQQQVQSQQTQTSVQQPSSVPQQQNNQVHQQITAIQPPIPHKGRMPRAKADARPRGRMTAYAFFVQTCREEHKKKHPEENVVFAEFSKKCAERWKTMLDKEKKRFHEMAEKDKKRYDAEMLNYTPPKGEKQRGKKRKQIKDPNAPKRSLSAFFWFCNDERSKVKSINPEFGVGDIAKELGRRWSDADAEVKAKYEAMAEKDKARYEKEMTAYKKRNDPSMQAPVPEAEEEEELEEEVEDDEDD